MTPRSPERLLHVLFSKLICSSRKQDACVLNAGTMSAFKSRRAAFESPQCPNCDSTNVLRDHRQAHLVCDDCGVILESSMISNGKEYRDVTYADTGRQTGTLHGLHRNTVSPEIHLCTLCTSAGRLRQRERDILSEAASFPPFNGCELGDAMCLSVVPLLAAVHGEMNPACSTWH